VSDEDPSDPDPTFYFDDGSGPNIKKVKLIVENLLLNIIGLQLYFLTFFMLVFRQRIVPL
jgi:hypothetical protein